MFGAGFGGLGEAVVDPGNPFAASATVGSGDAVSQGGESGLTGYSVISAGSLDAASEMAAGCPVLADGGRVEVYETFQLM